MKTGEDSDRPELYSDKVKAGKRTYFFDVRATRGNDYYIIMTESKKTTLQDGTAHYEKHKIFLYKEDLLRFADALHDAIDHIRGLMPDYDFEAEPSQESLNDTNRTVVPLPEFKHDEGHNDASSEGYQ